MNPLRRENAPARVAAIRAGSGSRIKICQLTDVAASGTEWLAVALDTAGQPVGDTLTVYVNSKPAVNGVIGKQPVVVLDPNLVVGDIVVVHWLGIWTGQSYIVGWWLEGARTFMRFGCTAP